MTTIFQRLTTFYSQYPGIPPLDHLHKSTLGRVVVKAWYGQNNRNQFKDHLEFVKSQEDTGIFRVLSYPDYYSEEIDRMIGDFYAEISKQNKPKRPRKAVGKKPVWSISKPLNNG